MLTIKIGEKELNVKFGYEATLKSKLISRMAKMGVAPKDGEADFEKIEEMLLFIPDVLLVGLQKHHSDEFGYNLNTRENYNEQREKVFVLVAEYIDEQGKDCVELFNELQEEMLENGFLAKMFRKELEKAEQEAPEKTGN